MTNITLDGLPAKTGTISDAGIIHYREGGVDKKMTVADFLIRISEEYSADVNTFLGAADKAAGRAALGIARRTAVSNTNYTILVTDKVVAQTGTMSAVRTFTLPTAALYPAGEELIIVDQSGTVTFANSITVARASSDTIDGETSMSITQKYGVLVLISDGTSKWKLKNISSPLLSNQFTNKNAIINGDFNIWQRATSFVSAADGTYSADRWVYGKSGSSAVHDLSRSTDVPTVAQSGRLFNYSLLVDCQTADGAVAAGDLVRLIQRIEGFNFLPLAQKTITLSFWVKATKIGIYCVSFANSGSDKTYIAEYTINTTDTWEYKTITITASPSAGTWNYTTGIGLEVEFILMAGSTFQNTANTWAASGLATSNQVNACDSTSNNFRLCGVQLEQGAIATPFEYRQYQQELSLCQRYYELLSTWGVSYNSSGAQIQRCIIPFKIEKRSTPTIVSTVISGSLTAPSVAQADTTNAWLGFSSASGGLEGKFSCTINSEL
jgi:hypothetical protein